MKPLIVLLIAALTSLLVIKAISKEWKFELAGRIAMSIMLVFTAIGHFAFSKGMSMMIPEFIPYKESIVFLTGAFEILLAIGLLLPPYRTQTAWILIIFLLMILPANIYASLHHVNYQTAEFDGHGVDYLFFRIPLQVFYIGWAFFSSVKG